MNEDTITRSFLGEDNKMRDIKKILYRDKDFLKIMAKM